MMSHRLFAGAAAAVVLLAGSVLAENNLKSGPQVAETVPGPFYPLNINGPTAGQKACLFCRNGANPVAMVFAREATPDVVSLIKKLDKATAENSDAKMGSFVVFCSDSEGLDKQLKDVVEKEGLKNIVLSVDSPTGPEGYNVAKDSEVTVVLYTNRKVKANYAFKKGEFKEECIKNVLSDVSKIIPQK